MADDGRSLDQTAELLRPFWGGAVDHRAGVVEGHNVIAQQISADQPRLGHDAADITLVLHAQA
jgi:hypothetical protein